MVEYQTKPVPPITAELIAFLDAKYPAEDVASCETTDQFVTLRARRKMIEDLRSYHIEQAHNHKDFTYNVRITQT